MSIQWMNEGDFVSLVAEEVAIFEQLLLLAERKFSALTSGDDAALSGIVKEEESLARKLSRVEARRNVLAHEAFPVLGLEEASLTSFARRFSPGISEKLMVLKEKGQETLFRLREIQMQNHRLLENAMQLLEVRLKAFRMAIRDYRYSKKGERLPGQGALLLNRRA